MHHLFTWSLRRGKAVTPVKPQLLQHFDDCNVTDPSGFCPRLTSEDESTPASKGNSAAARSAEDGRALFQLIASAQIET